MHNYYHAVLAMWFGSVRRLLAFAAMMLLMVLLMVYLLLPQTPYKLIVFLITMIPMLVFGPLMSLSMMRGRHGGRRQHVHGADVLDEVFGEAPMGQQEHAGVSVNRRARSP